MKAMILAAGLGTRLRPLTDGRPKALVEVAGRSGSPSDAASLGVPRTLLEITLARLRAFGVRDVIINVHHFADMIAAYLEAHDNFGMNIALSREDVLLDTGGGLKKAAYFFLNDPTRRDEPFILHNVDVISTIDLAQMAQFHSDRHALATLAVQARKTSRYLLFDDAAQLCGRRIDPSRDSNPSRDRTGSPKDAASFGVSREGADRNSAAAVEQWSRPAERVHALAFSGIHIISPRMLEMMTEEGAFSIIATYLRLAAQGERILAFRADEYYWRDLGRPDDLRQAAVDLNSLASKLR